MLDKLALTLATNGVLNWDSMGMFKPDLVGTLFGGWLPSPGLSLPWRVSRESGAWPC